MRRDVQEIFRMTPHEKQVMMFSATLSKEMRVVCKKFMQDVNICCCCSRSVVEIVISFFMHCHFHFIISKIHIIINIILTIPITKGNSPIHWWSVMSSSHFHNHFNHNVISQKQTSFLSYPSSQFYQEVCQWWLVKPVHLLVQEDLIT